MATEAGTAGITGTSAAGEVAAILRFWFGTEIGDAAVARAQNDRWWKGSADLDREIEARFGERHRQAVRGELEVWAATPQGRLALIVLVDQFSRNLHRGRADAFAHDALSRRWCRDGIVLGADRELRPIERVFFYLPLEHSESREDQARSVALFEALVAEVPQEARAMFEYYADYARRHRDVIERFNRFPHRDAVLGRASTGEEQAFLLQPGSSF